MASQPPPRRVLCLSGETYANAAFLRMFLTRFGQAFGLWRENRVDDHAETRLGKK